MLSENAVREIQRQIQTEDLAAGLKEYRRKLQALDGQIKRWMKEWDWIPQQVLKTYFDPMMKAIDGLIHEINETIRSA